MPDETPASPPAGTPDLRHLWSQLPVGPAPAAALVRAGRRRRATRRRTVGGLVAVAATAAAVALATAFPGGVVPPGPAGPVGGSPYAPVAYHGELSSGASCEALREHHVARALPHVTPYGWDEGGGVAELARTTMALADANTSESQASSDTGTNVQETGVDEPDVVKTDGRTLWRVEGDVLRTWDVTGAEPRRVDVLDLGTLPGVDDLAGAELLLSGTTLVAVGSPPRTSTGADLRTTSSYLPQSTTTEVVTLDVSDPHAPRLAHVATLDGAIAVRLHGTVLRVVTSTALPTLDFRSPVVRRGEAGRRDALRANRELVRATTVDDWLPHVAVDGGADEPLLPCDQVALPDTDLGAATVAVVGIDLADPGAVGDRGSWAAAAVAADAATAYASPDHVYLASVEWPRRGRGEARTHLFDFALEGRGAAYVGAGTVPGEVADRWAMDEHDGVLRVAVARRGANEVVTLRAEGDALRPVGRVGGIGPEERIMSVRWFDDLAVVVTFREVDPLYTVDLRDPAAPRVLGALKVPGYSAYLHPVGEDRLLGVGQGPTRRGWGAQVGLFDVRDLTRPARLDQVDLGAMTEAMAGHDPRQLTWLPGLRTALTVVATPDWRASELAVVRLDGDTLALRTVAVPAPPEEVRTVPLAGDRAVVSWDDGATTVALD